MPSFDGKNDLTWRINRWKYFLVLTALLLIAAYFIYFSVMLQQLPSKDASKWAEFGDFFGGILNPLVAFSAFYWLTKSVQFQKEELVETRKVLADAAKAQQDAARYQEETAKLNKLLLQTELLNAQAQSVRNEIEIKVLVWKARGEAEIMSGASHRDMVGKNKEYLLELSRDADEYGEKIKDMRKYLEKMHL